MHRLLLTYLQSRAKYNYTDEEISLLIVYFGGNVWHSKFKQQTHSSWRDKENSDLREVQLTLPKYSGKVGRSGHLGIHGSNMGHISEESGNCLGSNYSRCTGHQFDTDACICFQWFSGRTLGILQNRKQPASPWGLPQSLASDPLLSATGEKLLTLMSLIWMVLVGGLIYSVATCCNITTCTVLMRI